MTVPTADTPRARSRVERAWRTARGGFDAVAGRGTAFTHQPLGRHIEPHGLGGYYCDFRHKALAAAAHDDGFPRSSSRGGRAEWVIPVAQAALGYWDLRLEDDPAGDGFLPLADWLLSTVEDTPAGLAWLTPHPVPKYGLAGNWPSAMGQGEAISVLLRAHDLSGDQRYLEVARGAFEPFLEDVADGGLAREWDGRLVLEEYPAREPVAVLNGWVFALFGVHEFATATGDERAAGLFARSSAALIELLPRYDAGWWSLYSLRPHHGRPDLAKPFYQRLHPVLLDGLALIAPDDQLTHYARRWERQITRRAIARSSVDKLAFRVHRALRERRGRGAA
jgi:hypothetical protein